MKRVSLLICFCLLSAIVFSQTVNKSSEKYKSVMDSISSKYMGMKECHIKIVSKTIVSGNEVALQTYNLYKKNNEFYVSNNGMEMLFNTSIVLMVIHAQKQMVIRPITEQEMLAMKTLNVPKIDSLDKSVQIEKFSETDKYYLYTQLSDKGAILKTVYSYNKSTYLMEKSEYFYKDQDENKGQKTIITYTYATIPYSTNYFNTDKYLTKTTNGYVPAVAYSNYIITVNDPYEK